MKQLYSPQLKKNLTIHLGYKLLLSLATLVAGWSNSWSQASLTPDCGTNYFTAEMTDQVVNDDCLTRTLVINVDKSNKYGLSHFVVEVPCGLVTSVTNSGNWPMELNNTDPQSGVYGFKVDNINGFGDKGIDQTFTVQYTVCGIINCTNNQTTQPFNVVFKAATCQFTQTIAPKPVVPPLTATINPQNILCAGLNNGQIAVSAQGGVKPYTYLWSNGQTTPTISNLAAGKYSVTVTDSINQHVILSAEITQPTALGVSAMVTPSACSTPTGIVEISVTGGTAPYNYQWDNGNTSSKNTNLAVGKQTVLVTDANGCTLIRNYYIVQNTNLSVALTGSALECHQEGQGTMTTTVTGGTAPYSYTWSNGGTSQNLTELNSGRYQVTVTDSQGCYATQAAYVTIKQLTATVSAKAPTCNGDATGSATITTTNGTAPYSYSWSNGLESNSANNLTSGWYFVDITDANGCTIKKAVNIPTPTPLSFKTDITRNSCDQADKSVTVKLTGSGGTQPYTWTVNGNTSTNVFTADTPQSLTITMTDLNGCSYTNTANLTYPTSTMVPTATIKQPSCSTTTGSATIAVANGVQPITAVWPDGVTGLTRSDLSPGDYLVMVTDAIGCSTPISIKIEEAVAPTVNIVAPTAQDICGTTGNTITAASTTAVSARWTIVSDSSNWHIESSNLLTMTYSAGTGSATISVTTTDANGCEASSSLTLSCQTNSSNPNNGGDSGNGGGNTGGGSDNGGNDSGNGNGNGSNGGNMTNDDCGMGDNFWAEPISMTSNSSGCVTYKLKVSTDGYSEHGLSHFIIGVPCGTITSVNVSRNWPVSMNSTDPKSGVYGLKVDNINGFGQSGNDSFTVEYTVCSCTTNNNNEFEVVYKAATCQWPDTVDFNSMLESYGSQMSVKAYPNPFNDHATFELKAESDSNIDFSIYDLAGYKCKTLYNGPVVKEMVYKFEFDATGKTSGFYFYKLITPNGTLEGKILKR